MSNESDVSQRGVKNKRDIFDVGAPDAWVAPHKETRGRKPILKKGKNMA